MIELVLVYCLSTTPDRCVERREDVGHPLTAMECMVDAQKYAGPYLASHLQWELVGWRCEENKPREAPA